MRKKIIKYSGEKLKVDKTMIEKYKKMRLEIAYIQQELDPLEEQIKKELMDYMETNGKKSIKFNGLSATYKQPSSRIVLDGTRMKEEDPKLWDKYSTKQNVRASMTIKLDA